MHVNLPPGEGVNEESPEAIQGIRSSWLEDRPQCGETQMVSEVLRGCLSSMEVEVGWELGKGDNPDNNDSDGSNLEGWIRVEVIGPL